MEKDNELLNYSKVYENKKFEELSAIKEKYNESQQELTLQINEHKEKEKNHIEINKKLQQALQSLKTENGSLKSEINLLSQKAARQSEMMNIMADEDSEDERNTFKELEHQLKTCKDTLLMKEEVSIPVSISDYF